MKITIQDAGGATLAVCEIGENPEIPFNALPVAQNLLDAAGARIMLQFAIPIRDLHGTWICDYRRPPSTQLEWDFTVKSAQQSSIPYWCGFNLEGQNVATIAISSPADDVEIAGHMDQMRCAYHFTVTVAVVPETKPFDLLFSKSSRPWQELVGEWRKRVLPGGVPRFPDAAFLPVYCTWYAVHGALSADYLDRNAELAAQMGFGTFIVDDGWSYAKMRRVCPEELALGWYRCIGNWTVSEEKLPDFQKHVKYAQSLGLKYLLWVAPFFAGLDMPEYREAASRNEVLCKLWNEIGIFAPESQAAEHAAELCETLMRDWRLDGLKIDFLDQIPCSVTNPHGRGAENFFRRLSSCLRAVKPDALLEFRQGYATPQMLPFGTQFRAGDVPFDFLTNFQRLIQIRMVLGDGIPVHADPIYFHPDESAFNVARHMIAALAGVPMLSMELAALSAEHKAVIENYLNFYRQNLHTYKFGHWSMSFDRGNPEFLLVENQTTAIAIVTTAAALSKIADCCKGKKLICLNLGCDPLPLPGGRAHDAAGNPVAGEAAPVGGRIARVQ